MITAVECDSDAILQTGRRREAQLLADRGDVTQVSH